jgi:hypothetical protein
VLLSIDIVVRLGAIVFEAANLAVPKQPPPGVPAPEEPINPFGCMSPFVFVPTAVVFCMWMYRSYANLSELGMRGLRFSPGWAAGAFFVPILNLYRPCQIAQEMWRASTPGIPDDEEHSWQTAAGSGVVGSWWAFWLISGVVQWIAFRIASDPRYLKGPEAVAMWLMAGEGLSCVAALFAILMVWQLRARQEKKFGEVVER